VIIKKIKALVEVPGGTVLASARIDMADVRDIFGEAIYLDMGTHNERLRIGWLKIVEGAFLLLDYKIKYIEDLGSFIVSPKDDPLEEKNYDRLFDV